MRTSRSWVVIVAVVALALAACNGKSSQGGRVGPLDGPTTTRKGAPLCEVPKLQATEVGVTSTTITLTVMADVGSPLSPGLFQGSVDAVKAWATFVNEHGGLACRHVVIKTTDSKLSADEAKNGVVAACGDSLALLGTTALFLNDMRPAEGCRDKAGVATGIPDLAALQTEPVEQCSRVSFSAVQQGTSCPYSGSGVRDYAEATAEVAWFKAHTTPNLHGVFVLPPDLPSTITASTPVFAAMQQRGVKLDKQFGISALATQSQYTPVVQAIKATRATWVMSSLDAPGIVKLRKEALAQGANGVKVWTCVQACYSPGFIAQGGQAVEGEYVSLGFLPLEDRGSNTMLDTFLQYDKNPDSFGVEAFASGLLLQHVVDGIVTKKGPNGITRAAILVGLRTVHSFNAHGLIATIDVAGRKASPCIVIVAVRNGQWVQVDPVKKGTFDCGEPGAITKVRLDPVKAYHPS